MSKLDALIKKMCPNGVEYATIGEVCDVFTGGEAPEGAIKGKEPVDEKKFPIYSNGIGDNALWGYADSYTIDRDAVTFSSIGTIGHPTIRKKFFTPIIRLKVIIPNDTNRVLLGYLKYILEITDFSKQQSSVPNVNAKMIKDIRIPTPPIEVQQEVIRMLDTFTELEAELEAELTKRKQQYEYYRDQLLSFERERERVEWVPLETLVEYQQPTKFIVKSTAYDSSYAIPVLTAGQSFILGYTNEDDGIYTASKKSPVIIFDDFTTSFHWVNFKFKVKSSAMKILTPKSQQFNFRYVFYAMKCIGYKPSEHSRQWIEKYSRIKIPLPPREVQDKIVKNLDTFDKVCSDLAIGLPAEIEARHKQYVYYRDKLLSF